MSKVEKGETRWSNRGELGQLRDVTISKFCTGQASITLGEITREFNSWSRQEQQDFLGAYNVKPIVTSEDERIIEFLIAAGDPSVLQRIAILSTRHSNKAVAFDFLVTNLLSHPGSKSDFIVALGLLNDRNAIQPLTNIYQQMEPEISAQAPEEQALREFCYCCLTLSRLTDEPKYSEKLQGLADHSNPRVRRIADFIRHRDLWPKR
jgi:hypothetical protein